MPPRYAYWTIIAGGLPTAFRAAEREELLPTFQRIREKHPDAQMKWFARGKLWESQEASRVRPDDGRGRRPSRDARPDESRAKPEGPPTAEKRGRDWRPGGEHRDPRQKFIDQKKQKNAALRQDRWNNKNAPPREDFRREPRPDTSRAPSLRPRQPRPDSLRSEPPRPDSSRPDSRRPDSPRGDWRDRPPADRGSKSFPDRVAKPFSDRGAKPFSDRGAKPFSDRGAKPFPDRRPKPDSSRPGGPRADRPWRDRPRDASRGSDAKPFSDRGGKPFSDRGAKPSFSDRGAKPGSHAPHGSKPWDRKSGGSDRAPGFQNRSPERPQKPPASTPPPAERPDKPPTPSAQPPRAHIKSRRPFQPRAGFPKPPRRP